MSHLQGVVFIAVLCAVNAAVTVNVYEDDVETIRTNKAREVESCNSEACERICRLLGFNSGICVGDTCECRKTLKNDDQLKQNDMHRLDEGVSGTEMGGCDPNACYQLCRRLKFPSGTCVNGRCKCDNFQQEPDQLEQNDIPSLDEGISRKQPGGCDPLACDQLCRRLKFPSGTCVNGRCKCDNFRQDPEKPITEAMDNGVPDQVHAGCTNSACSTLCHMLGFRYGVCINSNTCKCSNVLRTDVLEIFLDQGINEYIANAVESNVAVMPNTVRDCDQLACTMGCQELGAPGGSCSLGECRCNEKDKENENLRSWRNKTCNNVNCYFMCRRWGYIGGSCHGDSCLCV